MQEQSRHDFLEGYMQRYSQYQEDCGEHEAKGVALALAGQKVENLRQKARSKNAELNKAYAERSAHQREYDEAEAQYQKTLRTYVPDYNNNLLDERVYRSQLASLQSDEKTAISEAKRKVESDITSQRGRLTQNIMALKNAENPENEKGFWSSSDEATMFDLKAQNASILDFITRNRKKNRRLSEIKREMSNLSDSNLEQARREYPTLERFLKHCSDIRKLPGTLTSAERATLASEHPVNEFIIPFILAIICGVLLGFFIYTLDPSEGIVAVSDTVARVIVVSLASIFMTILVACALDEEELAPLPSFGFIAILIYYILLAHPKMSFGAIPTVFFYILAICGIAVISFIVAAIDADVLDVISLIITFCGSWYWFFFRLRLPVPKWTVSMSYFLTNGVARYIAPFIGGILVYAVIKSILTKTRIGFFVLGNENKRRIHILIEQYNEDKAAYSLLYNFERVAILIRRDELLTEYTKALDATESEKVNRFKSEEQRIAKEYEKKYSELEQKRKAQEEEAQNHFKSARKRVDRYKEQLDSADATVKRIQKELREYKRAFETERSALESMTFDYGREENGLEEASRILQTMFGSICQSSEAPLRLSKGKLDDSLYFIDPLTPNKNGVGKLKKLNHNCKPIVCLYNEEEIQNGNISEGLKPYVLMIGTALSRTNNALTYNHLYLVDLVSNGVSFRGNQEFELFGTSNGINAFAKRIAGQKQMIEAKCSQKHVTNMSIIDLNEKTLVDSESIRSFGEQFEFGNSGSPNQPYMVSFILLPPDLNLARTTIPTNLWPDLIGQSCQRYGIFPIFFVEQKVWETLDSTHNMKLQTEADHVFDFYMANDGVYDFKRHE